MKKINSINYGGKVIGVGFLFAFLIPAILLVANKVLNYQIISFLVLCSFIVGILIWIGFSICLAIEFTQDKKIDHYYSSHKNIKLKMNEFVYECGACGNRKVKKEHHSCSICGCRFEVFADKTPQEILNGIKSEKQF